MAHIQDFWINEKDTNKLSRKDCCGCSACYQICGKSAITMRRDKEAFLYPIVDDSRCVDCGLCTRVCPVINKCESNSPYLKTFAGYSTDVDVMRFSTSGGFVTTLSHMVIDKGGIVYGVVFDKSLTETYYSVAETHEDLRAFAGSKYVQTDKTDVFIQVRKSLIDGCYVLFIGCPCDVAALKRFLNRDYEQLITCELVCMGVTSPKVTRDYKLWTERKNHSTLIGLNMRSKEKGWFVPHLEERFENGKKKCSTLFGTYLGYGFQVFNRPSCFFCQFRDTVGVGDIRVGDFWGIKETDVFWNPQGVSSIFIRTKKGLDAISLLDQYDFKSFETDYSIATQSNMSSFKNKPKKYQDLRDEFARVYIDENQGLVAACHSVASLGFWIKHFVPDSLHHTMKLLYHLFKDKKRNV